MEDKGVVLLSGGIDSTTCLAIAVESLGRENITALNLGYGQKHEKELIAARTIAGYYGVDYIELDIAEIFQFSNSSLLKHSTKEISKGNYNKQKEDEGIVDTSVPFRN